MDRIAVFRSASDLKECACCAVQRVTVVMLRCCVCAECGVAAVALLLLARCCVGLQKSITLSEPIPAQQPGAGCSKADDSLDLVNYADTCQQQSVLSTA